MATSLQQQLAAIAQKSTHSLDLKAQRSAHGQSLLFQPRDASTQTFDTIFDLTRGGFEDLCTLDSRFVSFGQSLFSEQSKGEDRTQMTGKENQELDAVIRTFLGLVSGRLLLKPAQKALEWLVRRFRIHDYNTEHLVAAFLPYHDDAVFATMLSLVPTSRPLPASLKFLAPYIKSLATVPRHAILYAAINNPSFFTLLNSFVLTTARQRNQTAPLLGFWTSITAQAINGQLDSTRSGRLEIRRQREDEILLKVIPLLQEAFLIKDTPELYLGSCMIAVILATKIELADQVLDGVMDAVAGAWSSHTVEDGIACLSVLSLERDTIKLPKTAAKKLLNTPAIASRLSEVASRYSIERLYCGIALCLIDGRRPRHSASENTRLLPDFFATSNVGDASKDMIAASIVRRVLGAGDSAESGAGSQELLDLTSGIAGSLPFRQCLSRLSSRGQLDVAALEGRLEIPLLLEAASQADGESDDVEMEDTPESGSQGDVADLQHLEESLRGVYTLLDTVDHNAVYAKVAESFSAALRSKSGAQSVLEHDLFRRPGGDVLLMSLLVRVWTTTASARLRQQALTITYELLQGDNSARSDPQVLLPYLIQCLGDPQSVVRSAGASVVRQVSGILQAAEKVDKLGQLDVRGKDAFYGSHTRSIKWMKSSDVHSFLSEALIGSLDECIVDPAIAGRLLLEAIDGTDDDLELKTSTRSSLFSYLISHAVTTPILRVRISLLKALATAGRVSAAGRKHVLLPAIADWIEKDDVQRGQLCQYDNTMLVDLDQAYIDSISIETEDELELIKDVALRKVNCSQVLYDLIAARLLKLWSYVSTRQQTHFTQELLNQALDAGEPPADRAVNARALLKQLRLSGDALVTLLQDVHSITSMPDGTPSAKRRRVSSSKSRGQAVSHLDLENMVGRLTLVLELVESSKPERHPELLKHLFHTLGDLQQIKSQLGSELVYLQQMIISSLLSLVDTLKAVPANKIDRSALRADLVVDCMRSTSSSQVHSSALLLISSMASWAPDLVLHSVMPIFTFMSNTILRQGDDYSAHIIDQTVSYVIPPLVSSLRKKNQDLITGAAELLLSFIAAFEHIPMHRRLQLFKQLVTALGPDESLSAVVAMLFERYPSDQRVPDFCAALANQFSPEIQLMAAIQYLDLVTDSLQPRRTVSEAIFSYENAAQQDVLESARLLVSSLARFMGEGQLATQVRRAIAGQDSTTASVHRSMDSLIDRSVGFSKTVETEVGLRSASEDVVTAVLKLLPTVDFVKSAEALLDQPEEGLALRLLQTLEKRTSESKVNDVSSREALLGVVPVISDVLGQTTSNPLKYAAIVCIDKIAEKFGKKNTTTILAAATIISSGKALGSDELDVRVLSLFALSTIVEVLKDEMVGILPDALSTTLGFLRFVPGKIQGRLWEASFTFMSAILDHVPWIISTEALRAAFESSIDASADPALAQHTRRARDSFLGLAARTVPAQVYLGSLESTLSKAYARSITGCGEVLNILDKMITSSTKSVLAKNHTPVLAVVRQLFDVRSKMIYAEGQDELADEVFDEFDRQRNSVLMKAVLKLNDATFRPWFVELADSAGAGDEDDLTEDDDRIHSLTSTYSFFDMFFSSLKSLVTSYSTYILDPAVFVLKRLQPDDGDATRLIRVILSTLHQTFEHDQDDFWSAPSHFDKMTPALLHQLRQSRDIAKEDPTSIISTITELASAASSAEHLKDLNGQLLKLTRAAESHVRLAAVKAEMALTERLGEDWLALLPEMLPFISELQEDEDEQVERQTLAWIKGIEGILGESLEGMLQ